MEYSEHVVTAPIAVIGLGCRFPGADGPAQFWNNLLANTDSVTPVPAERFDVAADYAPHSGTAGKTASRHGGFIDDVFAFDHAFFGISPAEAKSVDPQQRLLLQAGWEALEEAGIRPSSLAGTRTGVFVGQATAEYSEVSATPGGPHILDMAGSRLRAMTAGRLSFALDLLGPSVVLDTACSSSLVAVHSARQSLITGECDLAVAGGVNIVLSSHDAIGYSQGSMLSPDGRCRFGAADADGFVRSDGVGVVVLKRLADAERDGDRVLATILGSAVTNDGRGSGLQLHPAVSGQVAVLHNACRAAGIDPDRLDYVECHGSGTTVGDTVELRALSEATGRPVERPLLTGSVKTNIGHAESAAGIAGLIKAVLIAVHGVIPASLHCPQPTPVIDEEGLGVRVVTRNTELAGAGRPARIGVSSFGISGTNAHVVVGAYEPGPAAPAAIHATAAGAAGAEQLLVLSARSARSLTRLALSWASYLDGPGQRHPLHELCAAAALRRDAHPHRLWASGSSHADLAARLRALAADGSAAGGGIAEAGFGRPRRTAFVFSGQGSQWLGMGRGLLESSPAFRTTLTECDAAIAAELGWSVIELLTGATEFPTDIDRVQPALWAVQVSLAAALGEAGLDPDVCLGHSMGEIAASYVSGALSLRDACAVICRRSRLMRRLAGLGAMVVVELSAEAAREVLAERAEFGAVCVAAENSPTATVLAGPSQALAAVTGTLEGRDVLCRTVRVEVASHSPDMDLIKDELVAALGGLSPRAARTGLVSSVLAAPVRGDELLAQYWQDNLREPVRFTAALREVCREETVFLEVGPHPLLTPAVDETRRSVSAEGAALATLHRDCEEPLALLRTLGGAFVHGADVDWSRWYGAAPAVVDDLPTYAWDCDVLRRPGTAAAATHAPAGAPASYVREATLQDWGVLGWGTGVSVRGLRPLLPTVYLGVMLEAVRATVGERGALTDVRLGEAVVSLDGLPEARLRVTVGDPGANGTRSVRAEVRRTANAPLHLCAEATVNPPAAGPAQLSSRRQLLDSTLAQQLDYLSAEEFLGLAEGLGFGVDEDLRAIQHVWRGGGRAVARLRPAPGSAASRSMPAVCAASAASWEAGLLALLAAYRPGTVCGPTGFGSVQVHGQLGGESWALCRVRPAEGGQGRASGDVLLLDSEGFVLAEFLSIELQTVPHRQLGLLASLAAATPLAALGARFQPYGTASGRRPASRVTLPRLREARVLTARVLGGRVPVERDSWGRAQEGRAGRAPRTAVPAAVAPADQVTATAVPASTPPLSTVQAPAPAVSGEPVGEQAARPDRGTAVSAAEALVQRVARLLEIPEDQLDHRRPLRDLGLNSLMATQLRTELRSDWGLDVTAGRLLGPDSLNRILATIA